MQTNVELASVPRADRSPRKRSRRAFVIFLIIWAMLIGSGITGAKLYSDHLRTSMTADINRQTNTQLILMQQQYNEQLKKVEADYKAEIAALQSKVDTLNELLTFTKDNASAKTDNSNKLFTQLNEVKKQLDELKKNLDVLR